MDQSRINAIRARCEAATPGPWECRIDVGSRFYVNAPSYGVRDFCCLSGGFERREDAEFTANARTDIPDLIAEVRRLAKCRHECKIECLLGEYEKLHAENTRLRAELEAANTFMADLRRIDDAHGGYKNSAVNMYGYRMHKALTNGPSAENGGQ